MYNNYYIYVIIIENTTKNFEFGRSNEMIIDLQII